MFSVCSHTYLQTVPSPSRSCPSPHRSAAMFQLRCLRRNLPCDCCDLPPAPSPRSFKTHLTLSAPQISHSGESSPAGSHVSLICPGSDPTKTVRTQPVVISTSHRSLKQINPTKKSNKLKQITLIIMVQQWVQRSAELEVVSAAV